VRRRSTALVAAVSVLAILAGCGDDDGDTAGATSTIGTAPAADVCAGDDGALTDAGFVFVTAPVSGARVSPGFAVTGCSRTFESNVPWELRDQDGTVIARGAATGGGVDGPGAFRFTVPYTVPERQIGVLLVREDDPSGGEGRPPKDNAIPVVLSP
jgi:hypothetical protein